MVNNLKSLFKKITNDSFSKKNEEQIRKAKRIKLTKSNKNEQIINEKIAKKRIEIDDTMSMRLSKALSMSGVGGRRYCDKLIEDKHVVVNNKIAIIGQKITINDKVSVYQKNVIIKWPDRLVRIIIYHKQDGELITRSDPDGRSTVFDSIGPLKNKRFIAIGRLDFNTSGLLIFTTSGDLANKFTHPKYEVEREYSVRVYGEELTKQQISELSTGIKLEDGEAKFVQIEKINNLPNEGKNIWYRVIIKEGRNREVRRMFEYFNLTVSRLIRVRFGPIKLPPRLKRGQFYELNAMEVMNVMKSFNLNISGNNDNK